MRTTMRTTTDHYFFKWESNTYLRTTMRTTMRTTTDHYGPLRTTKVSVPPFRWATSVAQRYGPLCMRGSTPLFWGRSGTARKTISAPIHLWTKLLLAQTDTLSASDRFGITAQFLILDIHFLTRRHLLRNNPMASPAQATSREHALMTFGTYLSSSISSSSISSSSSSSSSST